MTCEPAAYQNKYILWTISILTTALPHPPNGLFYKIQKHKTVPIISCYFSSNHEIPFLYIYQAFKTSFKNNFPFLTYALLEAVWAQKYRVEDVYLGTAMNDSDLISNTGKRI